MQPSLHLLNDKHRVPLWLKRRDKQELYLYDRDFKIRRLLPPPEKSDNDNDRDKHYDDVDDDDDDDLTPFIKRKNTEIWSSHPCENG